MESPVTTQSFTVAEATGVPFPQNSLFFSLLAGNLARETGLTRTASATTAVSALTVHLSETSAQTGIGHLPMVGCWLELVEDCLCTPAKHGIR